MQPALIALLSHALSSIPVAGIADTRSVIFLRYRMKMEKVLPGVFFPMHLV
jgi:hypothetical protein